MISSAPGTKGTTPVLALVYLMVSRRWILIVCAVVFAAGFGLNALLKQRTFTVHASFMPEDGTSALASYAALAAQIGIPLQASTDNTQSPEYYAYLLQSNPLARQVVQLSFRVATDSGVVTAPLPAFFRIVDPPGNLRTVRTITALRRAMKVQNDARVGLIHLSVKTRWPDLSEALADSLITRLDLMNRDVRSTQAGAERRFTEGRLTATRDDLRLAENTYQTFLEQNRDINSSPALTFQGARLQRSVNDWEQLVVNLRQAYEQARLQEVRTTPILSIIERPELPLTPDRRYIIVLTLLGGIVGGLLGIIVILSRRSASLASAADRELGAGIHSEIRTFLAELRHPGATISRALGGRSRRR